MFHSSLKRTGPASGMDERLHVAFSKRAFGASILIRSREIRDGTPINQRRLPGDLAPDDCCAREIAVISMLQAVGHDQQWKQSLGE